MYHPSTRHILGFLLALAVIFGGSTMLYAERASRYAAHLQTVYQSGFSQLMGHISAMDTALEKTQYASSAARQMLAADIWRESSSAAALLSALPVNAEASDALGGYLSQTADYARFLLRSEPYGTDGAEKWDTLSAMQRNSRNMLDALEPLKERLDAGDILFPDPVISGDGQFASSLATLNEDLSARPTLEYDGACSDHLAERTALAFEGEKPFQQEDCAESVKKVLGEKARSLGDSQGQIPAYLFSDGDRTALFSKAGGRLLSFHDPRETGPAKLSDDDAIHSATDFVKSLGLTSMQVGDLTKSNGVCTVTMSDSANGVTAYGDSVRVGVALDDGAVVHFDASDYAMNHHTREAQAPAIASEDAKSLLPASLSLESERTVYRQSEGKNDVLCWEYVCNGGEAGSVVYYINCENGQIEAIDLLSETENGILRR